MLLVSLNVYKSKKKNGNFKTNYMIAFKYTHQLCLCGCQKQNQRLACHFGSLGALKRLVEWQLISNELIYAAITNNNSIILLFLYTYSTKKENPHAKKNTFSTPKSKTGCSLDAHSILSHMRNTPST